MDEDKPKSRLGRIADMKLGDYLALQTQGFGKGVTLPGSETPAAAKETADSGTGNSRLKHLAGMTATDIRNVRFEEEPEGGESAPPTYDLSG